MSKEAWVALGNKIPTDEFCSVVFIEKFLLEAIVALENKDASDEIGRGGNVEF